MKRSTTILVVDHEANLRATLAQILQNAGYSVTTAGSVRDALQCLKEAAYDLLLLEVQLPHTDGLTFLLSVRSLYPEVLVLILTACANSDIAHKAKRAGVTDYLVKPIDPAQIINHVNKIATRQPHCIS